MDHPPPPPPPPPAQELRLVDETGRPRIELSAKGGTPSIVLLDAAGGRRVTIALDAAGRPAVRLAGPDPAQPTAALEVDDKGAHVMFARPGGGSSYVFLNNAGVSGMVLIDAKNRRRLEAIVPADGDAAITRLGADGTKLP